MIRSYSVRIHSHIYNIDEDAYELMQHYYQNIRALSIEEKIKQVLIYELDQYVDQKLHKMTVHLPAPVVTLQMVEEILTPIFQTEGLQNTKPRKKYYRLKQKKFIAGVCTGLAAYFQTSVVTVRIIFLLLSLLAGLGLLVYIIIALNSHVAQNVIEILQVHGRPVTLNNMLQIITDNQFEYKKSRFPHIHLIHIKPSARLKNIFITLTRLSIGTILTFLFVFLAVSSFYIFFYEYKNNLSYQLLHALYPSLFIPEFIQLLLFAFISSIILMNLHHLLRLFFPDGNVLFIRHFGKVILYASSLLLTIIIVYTLVEFSDSEQMQHYAHALKTRTIEIDILDEDTEMQSSWTGLLFLQKPQIHFSTSPNDSLSISITFHAHGKYGAEAMDYCKNITYRYKIQHNKLNLAPYWHTNKKKFRMQRVNVHIQIPENTRIIMSKKFVEHFFQLSVPRHNIEFAFNAESFRDILFENK